MAKQNTTIKMDGGTAPSGDSVATIDVPEDGLIVGAQIYVSGNQITATTANMKAELNFGSANSFDKNDARSVIIFARWHAGDIQTAEGGVQEAINNIVFPDGLAVFAGERIHMHATASGITTAEAVALIVFRFKSGRVSRRC